MKSSRWRNHFLFFIFALALVQSFVVFAGPNRTTYQAKIVKPDGYPLQAVSVNFRFTILDPTATCVLYSENYNNVNMSSSSGLISFTLGSGIKSFPVSSTTFEEVFSNSTPFLSCDTGGPANYSPLANDIRRIVMQFNDGAGWQTLPAMNINAVPYAMYASDSQKLAGLAASEFVQVSTLPTCGASESLRFNGTSFSCIAVGGSGAVTSGAVITALGYTPVAPASLTTVTSDVDAVSGAVTTVSNYAANVSATVSTFQSTVAASFAAITSSQWVTSGSSISYNAGYVGIGTASPTAMFEVNAPVSAAFATQFKVTDGSTGGYFSISEGSSTSPRYLPTFEYSSAAVSGFGGVLVGKIPSAFDVNMPNAAAVAIDGRTASNTALVYSNLFAVRNDGFSQLVVQASGTVGIGTNYPVTKLDVSGGVRIGMDSTSCAPALAGTLRYNTGVVEYCNGTTWAAFGVSGAGILAINGLTSGSQTIAFGSTGTTPNVSSVGTVHTFNFPLAASASVTGGLLSNADYVTFNNKLNATSSAVISALAYTPANITSMAASFAAVTTTTNNLGTSVSALSTSVGNLATSMSTLSTQQSATAASLAAVTSSQWVTSGSHIFYNTGNVGIGTTGPDFKFDVVGASSSQTQIAEFMYFDNDAGSTRPRLQILGAANRMALNTTFATGGADLHLGTNTASNAIVIKENGNIGIRNNSPGENITVTGLDHTYLSLDSPLTKEAQIKFKQNGVAKWHAGLNVSGDRFDIWDVASATVRLTVNNSGNVGIGTATPSAKLHVSGVVDQELFRLSTASASLIIGQDTDLPSMIRLRTNAGSGVAITGSNDTAGIFVNTSSNVGIGGLHIPTAALHLRAGATTLAPLKFTSGALTTTGQAGAMEFDGNYYYLTDNANVRRIIATGSVSGAIDNASIINSSGNITMVPNNSVVVSSTLASTNPTTGALVVKGGVGVGGDVNVSGTITAANAVMALSTGAVAIGVSVPTTKLDVRSEASQKGFRLQYSGTGFSTQPNLELHRSRGTIEAPTAVLDNDVLGAFTGLGYDGTSYGSGSTGAIFIKAAQNFSVGNHGTMLTFATTASGSTTQSERMRLDENGNLGIGTTNPTAKLDVNGAIRISQNTGTFFFMRETVSGAPTGDGMRWSYEEDAFGTNYDGMVLEKTDGNGSNPDGGFLFASRGINDTRVANLAVRSWGVAIGTSSTPLGPLHVVGGLNPALALEDDDDGIVVQNYQPTLTFKDVTAGDPDDIRMRAENTYLHFETSPDFFVSAPVTTTLMTLRPNGNLGLGDPNPNYNISVINASAPATVYLRHMLAGNNDPAKIVVDESVVNAGQFWIQPTDDFDGAGSANDKFHIGDYDSKQSRFTVMGNGNVGIGTSAPTQLLQVGGGTGYGLTEVRGGGAGFQAGLRVWNTNTATGSNSFLDFGWGVSGAVAAIQALPQTDSSTDMYFQASNQSSTRSTMLYVDGSTGNVGIGTTSASARLEVNRATTAGSQLALVNNAVQGYITVPTAGEGIILSSSRYDGANWVTDGSQASALTVSDGEIQFFTNNGLTSGSTHSYSERARFDANGNFLVGTSSALSTIERMAVVSSGPAYLGLSTTNGTHKRSGIFFRSGSVAQMEIGVDANVNGGRDFYIFDSVSNTQRVVVTANGNVGINHGSPTYLLQLGTDSAAKPGTTTWTVASDMRLKDSRAPFTRGIDELLGLETIYFNYKKNNPLGLPSDKEYVGIRAQDVQKVIPEAVNVDKKGFLHFTSDAVFWTAVNAIKQLYHKVIGHDAKLEKQEREIASIKEQNEFLKQQNADKDKQLNDIRAYLCAKDPAAPVCK